MVFKVGDRVEMIDPGICDPLERLINGTYGTVRKVSHDGRIGVEWDNLVGGHTLGGMCADGHGWWVPAESLDRERELTSGERPKPYRNEDLFAFLGI